MEHVHRSLESFTLHDNSRKWPTTNDTLNIYMHGDTGTLNPAELDLLVRWNKRIKLKTTIRKQTASVLLLSYGIILHLRRWASAFVYICSMTRGLWWKVSAIRYCALYRPYWIFSISYENYYFIFHKLMLYRNVITQRKSN